MRGTFYTTEKLGPKQSLTPEGFLLCEDVPLARIGTMLYGPDETPIKAGADGVVKIEREADDVFTEETIASAQGKPVTNDHPEEDVTPENWKELCIGTMLNVRRGTGVLDDLLLGDLLITTADGIETVRGGKIEVSLGYDAEYTETAPGVGKQTNIIVNHIALVEQGRCGPRCAIKDSKPKLNRSVDMSKKSNRILDALMAAFKAKDAKEVEEIAEEVKDSMEEEEGKKVKDEKEDGGDTHVHVHANDAAGGVSSEEFAEHKEKNDAEHKEMFDRISELEEMVKTLKGSTGDSKSKGQLENEMDDLEEKIDEYPRGKAPAALTSKLAALKKEYEAQSESTRNDFKNRNQDDETVPEEATDEFPEELQEKAKKAKDSAYFADSFQDTVALAEILVPGIRVPTYDRAAKPGQTFKKICGLRRSALDIAYTQPATRSMLDEILAGRNLDTKNMTCDAVRSLFRSAAAAQRAANNAVGARDNRGSKPGKQAPRTLAEINRMNADKYAQ